MARPTKSPDEIRKIPLKFWGNKAEALELDNVATSYNMTRADFMKSRCLGVKPKIRKAEPQRAALIEFLGPLGFIRSDMKQAHADINQLLKDRWAYKFVSPEQVAVVFAAIEKAAADIAVIADHIHNDLERDH